RGQRPKPLVLVHPGARGGPPCRHRRRHPAWRKRVRPDVRRWLDHRTFTAETWQAPDLVTAKRSHGCTVSVVLPALDEERTVGSIVATIREELVERCPLVDELVFVDSDLIAFDPQFVVGLLGPLLTDPTVGYVKALYDRPLTTTDGIVPSGGGRVTELVARPLLNAFWPELAGFVQPLSGEYAGRRELLEQVPFVSGYGVELGLLVDLVALAGLDALAQVDLGTRQHTHQADAALGRMAGQILQTALARRPGTDRPERELLQFLRTADGLEGVSWDVGVVQRPPMRSVRA